MALNCTFLALLFGVAGLNGFSLFWIGSYEPAMRYPHVIWWQLIVSVPLVVAAVYFWWKALRSS